MGSAGSARPCCDDDLFTVQEVEEKHWTSSPLDNADELNMVQIGNAVRSATCALARCPVRPACGIDEADLALQMVDRGFSIVQIGDLRVRHATNRAHQAKASVTAAHISNTALLAFLRYPIGLWPLGLAQTANRVLWSLRNRRSAGVWQGIVQIPGHLWRYRSNRTTVAAKSVQLLRTLRPSIEGCEKSPGDARSNDFLDCS